MEYYILDVTRPLRFLHAGKSQMNENWMHYERTIDEDILFMVLKGDLYLRVDGVDYALHTNDIFFMRAGAHHIGYKPAAVTFYWLHMRLKGAARIVSQDWIDRERIESAPSHMILPMSFNLQNSQNFIISINHLIHYYSHTPQGIYNDYLATAILIELSNQGRASMTWQNQPLVNQRLDEIRSYIVERYWEQFSVAEIAEKFGYNKRYLSWLFRVHFQTTVKSFIIETRLKAAEAMLLSTNDSISVIAAKSGFNNEYYFMKKFKERNGLSPTQYRNTYYLQELSKYD